MIAPDLETAVDELRELVARSKVIVPFTGAGISTECGIPDFRSPGGIWTKMRPIDFSRLHREPGGARRILAAALRHGGVVRRRKAGARASGAGQPLSRGQVTRRGHPEHRQPAPRPLALHPNMLWSCTATRPMRPVSIVRRVMSCLGSGSSSTRAAARRLARHAAATSRPRRSRSGRPCRKTRCAAPRS